MIDYLSPDYADLPGRRGLPRNFRRDDADCDHVDVSIVTPYFNTEAFFVETFVSVQAQSLQNWEWVIVDDGSTDQESVDRLAEVAAKDPRIKLIRQANAGPGAARNAAFRQTAGRYVCLLDSDDMVEPTYLEKCVWFLDSNPEFAFCNSHSVVFGEKNYLWTTGFERGKAHLQANSGPPISVIRRSAYADCGGFDESIRIGHEDWDFWLAMAKAGHWGYTIPEYLQWYRKRGDGRFEQTMRSGKAHEDFAKAMRQKYEGLDRNFPAPARSLPLPYETIETTSPVTNPLAENPSGRRILFIVPWMVTGGADRVNLDLIEGLTSRCHDVTVCATLTADHRWESQFSRFTPDIFVLPNILRASDYPRFLAYLIQSRRIDTVVITGSTIGYQLLPFLRSVSPGVAFVDMCHVEEPDWLNGGHPRFGVGYQDALDLNVVTTRHLAEWMRERGAESSRIRVMYTGVRAASATRSTDIRARIRSELAIAADVPLLVFAGRLCEQKRPTVLAEILSAVRQQGLVFHAVVIGDGELREQFEALLKQFRLADNVRMLGAVSHRRWLEILATADILLMPSRYEGVSVALLEALASGVVPVVAKVGGQDEIVSPAAGVLIPHGGSEVEEYSAAIRRLLTNPEALHGMSEQCRALAASKLSWTRMIDNFEALLDDAHQLRLSQPRSTVSRGLGLELAAQALECKRLGEALNSVWNADRAATGLLGAAGSHAVVNLAVRFSRTWPGRMIVRSPVLKALGKKVLRMMAGSRAA